MKLLFLCRQEKRKLVVQRQPFSGELISSHCTLPAISIFYFINQFNLTLMRLLTKTAKRINAGKHLLLAFLLLLTTLGVLAQQKKVSGAVKNPEDGLPIAKATVQIKGTSTGTVTDEKGAWTLMAGDNQTLVISAIGFTTQEIKVGTKTTINVDLVENNTEMEGVVVTALGIKREEKLLLKVMKLQMHYLETGQTLYLVKWQVLILYVQIAVLLVLIKLFCVEKIILPEIMRL